MSDVTQRGSTQPQPYSGPERRDAARRALEEQQRQVPRVIGSARVRGGYYPSLQRDTWYPVVDRNPEAIRPEPLEGYCWLQVDGRLVSVWKEHLEMREGSK